MEPNSLIHAQCIHLLVFQLRIKAMFHRILKELDHLDSRSSEVRLKPSHPINNLRGKIKLQARKAQELGHVFYPQTTVQAANFYTEIEAHSPMSVKQHKELSLRNLSLFQIQLKLNFCDIA